MAAIKQCLALGADIDEQDEAGWTALMLAAAHDDKPAVAFLVCVGAKVNLTDNQGQTALFWAAYHGHADTCRALIEGNADLSMQFHGKTATEVAADRGHEQLKRLLAGVLLALRKHSDLFLQHTEYGKVTAAHNCFIMSVQLFRIGCDQIWTAAALGSLKGVKYWLGLGVDVNEGSADAISKGFTPLMCAAESGQEEMVKFLIEQKADINKKADSGEFALQLASFSLRERVCQVLLEAGADKQMQFHNYTAAQWAEDTFQDLFRALKPVPILVAPTKLTLRAA